MIKSKLLLIILLICISCGSNVFDTQEKLSEFINEEENGFLQKKTVNGIDFQLLYRPTDLLVDQEIGKKHTDAEIKKLRTKYGQNIYFNLSMSKNNTELLNTVSDEAKFANLVNELSFGLNSKVHLYSASKDTIGMIDFVYPRMYGTTNATTILLVYPRHEEILNSEYLNLTVEDLGFATGEIRFKIDTKILKKEPTIRF